MKVIPGLVINAILYFSGSNESIIIRKERVFPKPISPIITAKHSFPSLIEKIVSEITFSMEILESTYMEGSGTLSNGGFLRFQYSQYIYLATSLNYSTATT
jgi:hypothetical protein